MMNSEISFRNFYLMKKRIKKLILSILDEIKNEEVLIILVQYKEELFNDQNFIKNLKSKIFNIKSKLKVVISSSINDGPIRDEYLNTIKNSFKPSNENEIKENKEEESEGKENKRRKENYNKESNNKTNNFIPYHFLERLVDEEPIKENIKEIKKHDDKI